MNHSPASSRKPVLQRFLSPRLWAICAIVAIASSNSAQAQGFGLNGFQPFGFYQPYGIQYRSSVATPPYFSVNPPVYYGTRHYRPYGISPFAAPPQVTAPASYQGQAASSGLRSRSYSGPVGNPFICRSNAETAAPVTGDETVSNESNASGTLASATKFVPGQIQLNPFVSNELQFARRLDVQTR